MKSLPAPRVPAALTWLLAALAIASSPAQGGEPQRPASPNAATTPAGLPIARDQAHGLLCDGVTPRPRMPGAPAAGDVIMRSLCLRPMNQNDRHDTMAALQDFHATTLAWAYIDDPQFIARVKRSGRVFGGAAAAPSYLGEQVGANWLGKLAVLDRRGEVIMAPWKRTWEPTLWGCVNNPELERGYLAYLKKYIDAGAEIMQRDEPGSNDSALRWGGCFCEHCMKAFRAYLANHTTAEQREQLGILPLDSFDYRVHLDMAGAPVGDGFGNWNGGPLKALFEAFQTGATVDFHRRTRAQLDAYAGRHVPFSCNNGVQHWTGPELAFDWAFGELAYSRATAHDLYQAMREAAARGRVQIVTMPKKADRLFMDAWTKLTRQTVAMAYACGGHCMVPWDVYMPGDAPRFFGDPADYADLFGFIRANRGCLDDYEQAAATGYGIPLPGQTASSPVCLAGGDLVSVIVRASPGRHDAPVAIHLIDWAEAPQPFALMLDPARFFGERPLRLRLLTPAPYAKDAHQAADRTGNYAALSKETLLGEGRLPVAEIPALAPWAILLVEPAASNGPATVWQPAVFADPASRFASELAVTITCATPGASIRYTLDGSVPSRSSAHYTAPLRLSASTEVRAIAFLDRLASSPARADFARLPETGPAAPPDAASVKDSLVLWLSAESLAKDLADGDPVPVWPARAGPAATVPTGKLPDGTSAAAPVFRKEAMQGQPALQFNGTDGQLFVNSFSNQQLAGSAFTLFMVTRSPSPDFGICGNSQTGSGGIPRLYLTRQSYRYNDLHKGLDPNAAGEEAAISVFAHDGIETISAWVNGEPRGKTSGLPRVAEFGSGGHLAVPFRAGNRGQPGDIAEIIAYNRLLTDRERRAVESWLADRYQIPVQRWK